MNPRSPIFSAFALAVFLLGALTLRGVGPVQSDHVESELVSEVAAIEAGEPFTVGLRMRMDEHWHTYWINPGDSGLATMIEWTLPEGFSAGPIRYPAPERIPTPPLMTYGFEGEILLLVEITPAADIKPGDSVTLKARADWLVCKELCIPGGAEHSIELPVAESAAVDVAQTARFVRARAALPASGEDWQASFTTAPGGYALTIRPPPGEKVDAADAYFFALEEMVIEPAEDQVAMVEDGRITIRLKKSAAAGEEPSVLRGVLTGGRPVLIEATRGSPLAVAGSTSTGGTGAGGGFLLILPLAFLGGLVLNLMPCVFPVLGIKILGFVNQAGADRRKVTMHGLIFALGVLTSFWALAGVLIALRAGGEELGWGFQLQSPIFVFALAVFLLIFALNLSGLFEVGLSATGVGSSLQSKSGYGGSFFTGVLATVVATPCSAPFLAPALGAAVALSAGASIAIFTVIALGLSTPYLVLSIFPGLIKFLPRPGAWMETFKQLMAFPLYATVGFLVWVLAGQVQETVLLKIFFSLVLISMAAWAYGRWTQGAGGSGRKVFGYGFAALALLAGLWMGFPSRGDANQIVWEKWSPDTVAAMQSKGRIVYVDFTARWCATCQSNKALVFSSDEVRARFDALGVAALKADWTNRDPAITRALESHGRSAVPLNLVYVPGRPEPIMLPEVLTPDTVLRVLQEASG